MQVASNGKSNAVQISQPSIIANTANNTQVLGGEQVNQGLELNVFGEVADGVRLLGGVMFLNAVLTKTQGGLTDGWTAPFSPGAQFNLAGEWDTPFLRGLTLTGRVTYTGAQYIDTTYPRRSLPEWTRLDIGARYALENVRPTGKPAMLRFGVENLCSEANSIRIFDHKGELVRTWNRRLKQAVAPASA